MRSLLLIQFALVLGGVAVSFFYQGDSGLLPAFYGGSVALASTLMLSGRLRKVDEIAKTNPERSVYSLYFGVIQRFVFVLVALGVGLGALKLAPLPVLGTFMVAQLAFVLMGTRQVA